MRPGIYLVGLLVLAGVLPFGRVDRSALAREYIRQVGQESGQSGKCIRLQAEDAFPADASEKDGATGASVTRQPMPVSVFVPGILPAFPSLVVGTVPPLGCIFRLLSDEAAALPLAPGSADHILPRMARLLRSVVQPCAP